MNPTSKAITRADQLDRARIIQRSLGTLMAARYMRVRDWSIEAALYWLVYSTGGTNGRNHVPVRLY